MPSKKTTKKKTARKKPEVKTEIKVIYADAPMDEIELAGALNVPFDDPQRKAVFQILDQEIDVALGLTQNKADNHGKLAEAVGALNALRYYKDTLTANYEEANRQLHGSTVDAEGKPSASY
jgi:hypothetical protein